jgi:hypothetical protein
VHRIISASLALLGAGLAAGAEPDKSAYHLFHPTPRALMRELATDRPDRTESPFTVDAGHVQIEMDVLSYSYDRHNPDHSDQSVETAAIAPFNLKLGLLNWADLQLILQPHVSVRTHNFRTGQVEHQRGLGDLVARVKVNLWGNDAGRSALAAIPLVKLPTGRDGISNGSVEGGITFPFTLSLPAGWTMGAQTQFDFARDDSGDGHHAEFINSITFSHAIAGNLSGYVEFFSLVSTERGSEWQGTADIGFTYALTEDIQLDAGVNIGVTRAADDWNPFVGVSWRF